MIVLVATTYSLAEFVKGLLFLSEDLGCPSKIAQVNSQRVVIARTSYGVVAWF